MPKNALFLEKIVKIRRMGPLSPDRYPYTLLCNNFPILQFFYTYTIIWSKSTRVTHSKCFAFDYNTL